MGFSSGHACLLDDSQHDGDHACGNRDLPNPLVVEEHIVVFRVASQLVPHRIYHMHVLGVGSTDTFGWGVDSSGGAAGFGVVRWHCQHAVCHACGKYPNSK